MKINQAKNYLSSIKSNLSYFQNYENLYLLDYDEKKVDSEYIRDLLERNVTKIIK